MTRLLTGCMLLTVSLAAALPLAAGETQAKGNKYAFLVGCSKYFKTEFRTLPYSGNDVNGFRDALIRTGFPTDNIIVLHEDAKEPLRYLPLKANILNELKLLVNGLRKQDTMVVALSGHGVQFKGDPVTYFVPVDGKVHDKSTLIALSGKDGLYDILKTCAAQQKLIILNACTNNPDVGLGIPALKVELVDEDRKEVPEGIAAIYACTAGERSYYDADRKLSLFFDHAIRAWKGEYDPGREVTLEMFFEHVVVKTKMDANKTLGAAQTPFVQREYAGKWVIATADLTKKALAKPKQEEQLLAGEFAEFSRLYSGSRKIVDGWLEIFAATRLTVWKDAAIRGSPEAMVLLGSCFYSGKGLPRDDVEAAKWFRKAAELGNPLGQITVGVIYEGGRGVPKDEVEAVKWYRKAAEQGDAGGQYNLGDMYENGHGVAKDVVEAVKWYRKAAEQGHGAGQNSLGFMFQYGRGVAKDETEAVKWYRQAAEQGNTLAQNNLATMYKGGRGVAKEDVEAVKWYRKAAEQGNAAGQNNIGLMYENGRGVAKDDVEAVKWYRKAAEQGNAAGQNNIGSMYENGRSVATDYAEAARWYRKAAEQGNAEGHNNLATMYKEGRGVAKDDVEAVRWYRKAAAAGHAEGQNNLGLMYEQGRGIPVDLAEAVQWYRLASQGGNQAATEALRRLGKQ